MTPERWQQIRELLEEALELAPEQRVAFLQRACPSDASLRQEVETLLASDDDLRSSFLQSAPPRVALAAGSRLGQYEVKSLLGAGGMGEVYRARDVRLGRDVAIKILPSFFSSDSDRLRRFEQEAQAAAALNHPNILAVFQLGAHDGAPYLVSELLEGETLRAQLMRGRLTVRKAIDYGVQMARGLSAAHEKGIVHRDLKPENLFACKDGRVKILDFGLAKLTQPQPGSEHSAPTLRDETEPGVVMGTVGYMSPEQVRGQIADHRTDIFSFGAILYEMLAGKRAFQKATPADTMSAILNEDPPGISQVSTNIPPPLQRVVRRCLEKSPEQRFQSASDLAFALDALSEASGQILRPGLHEKAAGAEKQPHWLSFTSSRPLTGAAVIALVLLIGFAFWWLTPLPDPKIQQIFPVTDTARQDYLVRPATDGARIFYVQRAGDHYDLMQASVNGGDAEKMTAPFPNTLIWDVAPDGSHYLITSFKRRGEPSQLWSWPVTGGPPVKLDGMISGSATYSPDGKMIAYHIGKELWIGNTDGSGKRKLGTFDGSVDDPAWSPDNKRLRFTINGTDGGRPTRIWEIGLNGEGLRNILPQWTSPAGLCCGTWTPDGKYFVFVEQSERSRMWALREKSEWFRRSPAGPFLLASEAGGSWSPLVSRDGKHVYFYSNALQVDMETLDVRSHQFTAFLPGKHPLLPGFSRDGRWVAYIGNGELWRSRLDGTEARKLPFPDMHPGFPRWSPDGKTLAFSADSANSSTVAYVVDTDGGQPQPLVAGHESLSDPDWSGDGSELVAYQAPPASAGKSAIGRLVTVGWRDRQIREIPGSEGMWMPRWSPNGRWIAALRRDEREIELYEVATQRWRPLVQGESPGIPVWSADSAYLYYQDLAAPGEPLNRVKLASGAVESVFNFQAVIDGGVGCGFMALTNDGRPVIALGRNSDIYGATLLAP